MNLQDIEILIRSKFFSLSGERRSDIYFIGLIYRQHLVSIEVDWKRERRENKKNDTTIVLAPNPSPRWKMIELFFTSYIIYQFHLSTRRKQFDLILVIIIITMMEFK